MDFAQKVADKISSASMLVEFYIRLYQFHLSAETKIPTREFSEIVLTFLKDRLCDDYAKKSLRRTIMAHPDCLSWQVLEIYLTETQDEELAEFYVDRFFSLKPDFDRDISVTDDVAWRAKNAFAAINVMANDQLPDFCGISLKMFPRLPWGDSPQKGGLRGLLLKTCGRRRSGDSFRSGQVTLINHRGAPAERRPIGGVGKINHGSSEARERTVFFAKRA